MNDSVRDRRRLFLKSTLATGAVLACPVAAAGKGALVGTKGRLPSAPGMMDWRPVAPGAVLIVGYAWDLFHGFENVDVTLDQWSEPLVMGSRGTFHVRVNYLRYDEKYGPIFAMILGDAQRRELARNTTGNGGTSYFPQYGVAVDVRHGLHFDPDA
jgi:hypothetical protein